MSLDDDMNLELITLIWLDQYADATQENRDIQDKLRSVINYLRIFDNYQSFENYIANHLNEKIILITSGQFGQEFIPNIHHLRQIISIFVFCGNKQKHLGWTNKYNKIRNVVVELNDLLIDIEIDRKSIEQKLNQSIEFSTNNHRIYSFLLQIESTIIDRREFLNICSKIYKTNRYELANIEEFEHLYCSSNALKEFFNETFLYRLLIKSLQTLDINILYLLRFYLQDIEEELKTYPILEGKSYRGQLMTIDQIEYFNQLNDQTILRFNSYLIAYQNEEQVRNALQNSTNTNGLHKVLFQIDSNSFGRIFKQYILFPITTQFQIISIRFEKRIWFVNIKICHFNQLKSKKKRSPIEFAHYLRELSLFDQAEKFFHLLLKQYPLFKSQCYDGLARIAQDKGLYDMSLHYYIKSFQTVSWNCRSYCLNNIACAYDYLEEYDKALEYYYQSYSLMKNNQHKSMLLNNMGITYANIEQYQKGIEYLEKSLGKRKDSLKDNQIHMGISYNNLGVIYLSIQQFPKAEEYFYLALKLFQGNKSHVFKGILYQNMGELFQQTNLVNKSLQFYQDALDIFRQFKPSNHQNIHFIQQQILLLKQNKSFH